MFLCGSRRHCHKAIRPSDEGSGKPPKRNFSRRRKVLLAFSQQVPDIHPYRQHRTQKRLLT